MGFSPWIPVLVTVFLGLCGLGLQGIIFAFFMGKMKVSQEITEKLVDGLVQRMNTTADEERGRAREDGALGARLDQVQQQTAGIEHLRETVTRLDERFAGFSGRVDEGHEALRRDLTGLQRQLGALVSGSAGAVVEIHRPGRTARSKKDDR